MCLTINKQYYLFQKELRLKTFILYLLQILFKNFKKQIAATLSWKMN